MAGDWIKMRSNLWDDPRVARICDLTDSTEGPVVGALYWLWASADQHTEDGCMPGLTLRQIDRKTGLPGFAAALCEIGWLADDPQGVVIVKFEEHNGTSAKRRCSDAQRKASGRSVSASHADNERTAEGSNADEKRRSAELEEEEEKRNTPTSDEVGSREASPASTTRLASVGDPCPHQAIIDAFHRLLPTARQVRDWTPTRQALLRARWREDARRQSLEWWERFFAYCAKSKFLTGSAAAGDRKPFELGLEWLVKPENFAKVREGKYHDAEEAAAA